MDDNGHINPTCISLKAHRISVDASLFLEAKQAASVVPRACVAEISLAKCTNPCGKKRFGSSAKNQTHQKKRPEISPNVKGSHKYTSKNGRSIQHHLPNSVPKHLC